MYDPLNWPTQPGDPSAIRVASVIGLSVLYSLFLFSLFSYIFYSPTAVSFKMYDRRTASQTAMYLKQILQ